MNTVFQWIHVIPSNSSWIVSEVDFIFYSNFTAYRNKRQIDEIVLAVRSDSMWSVPPDWFAELLINFKLVLLAMLMVE